MARGGRKGGRSRGPVPRDVLVSKKLSWLLRHGAQQEGLTLGRGGYANLAQVLATRNIKSIKADLAEIKTIVAENEKQRFSLIHVSQQEKEPASDDVSNDEDAVANPDPDPANYLIRANQGHSLKLEDDTGLLTPITTEAGNLPDVVVHGTRREVWRAIVASGGLKPMTRNHVHFAMGVPAALQSAASVEATAEEVTESASPAVLSGMRNSSTLLMYLDLPKALSEGKLSFGKSANGVVLTAGDESQKGLVSLSYFKKVEERGGKVLLEDGKVL